MTARIVKEFLEQNPGCEGIDEDDIETFAEHHSGGLVVLGAPTVRAYYVKLHDTWGPGTPNEPGDIVVHEYPLEDPREDTGAPVEQTWTGFTEDGIPYEGWSDDSRVYYFDNGREAFDFFLGRIG